MGINFQARRRSATTSPSQHRRKRSGAFRSRSTKTVHVCGQHRAACPAAARARVYENLIDVDEHYVAEMHDRALVLKEDPLRCQSLPHMTLRRLGYCSNC